MGRIDPILAGSDLTIHVFGLDDDRDIDLAAARTLLSPAERDRMGRFVFDRDRDRFARGRGFLRMAVAQALDCDPAALPIEAGPNGKPMLSGGAIEFNLSHADDLAVLGLSRAGQVGIDVELTGRSLGPRPDLMSLARHCFQPHEIEAFERADPAGQNHRFLSFWTAKEARMKVRGDGMSLPPKRIALTLSGDVPVGFSDLASRDITLARLRIPMTDAICHVTTATGSRSEVDR